MLRARDGNSRPVRGAARGLEELCACPPTAPLDCYTDAARYAGEVAAERKACAYVRMRQNTCAYVSIRAHASAYDSGMQAKWPQRRAQTIPQAYVSRRQHMSTYLP